MSNIIISKDPSFIANLHCFCGKDAEIAWHAPLKKEQPNKLSKSEDKPKYKSEIYPMGWACNEHVPEGIGAK